MREKTYMNKIVFNAWTKNTKFPKEIGNKTQYSIEGLDDAKDFTCSYRNGVLKASKNGEDIFVKETNDENFSKNIFLMHKKLLPDTPTFNELLDRLSLEG